MLSEELHPEAMDGRGVNWFITLRQLHRHGYTAAYFAFILKGL
jgi:hypothetical protein